MYYFCLGFYVEGRKVVLILVLLSAYILLPSEVNAQMFYDSLIKIGPDGNDIPWLAERFFAETHVDNPTVPDDYTRFTFDIIDNATWTDGQSLTAEDIAFSLNLLKDLTNHLYIFFCLWRLLRVGIRGGFYHI